ncbi:MAG: FAD:protein FMN transferase [Chitinophagaceae bacterium]|nr:FAD:protein FMN transferase [Chitinophagaceae bacterium]
MLPGIFNTADAQVLLKRRATLMGSVFEITVADTDSVSAGKNIHLVIEEITRIENLISEWRPWTQVSEVNRNAGIQPVTVDRELFDLTQRALRYSHMSDGAFDISIAAMDRIWKFDGTMTEVPDRETIRRSVDRVGYEYIELDSIRSTIYLSRPGMKIGFGSIGKGYAADKGRVLMQSRGVQAGIVNASGDIATWGEQPGNKPWRIGVDHPFKPHKMIRILQLRKGAVATSGSYRQYAEIDGTHYSHIINPKTGYPSTGLISVTVYGPSAEFANALSTSVMVLGKKKGRKLLRRFREYRYILVSDSGRVIKR